MLPNMTPAITVRECLSFGWSTFKSRPWFFIAIALVIMVIMVAIGLIEVLFTGALGAEGMKNLDSVVSLIQNVFVSMGTLYVYLRAHDAIESAKLEDLWQPQIFWRYLGVSILSFIAIMLGFILLIVPGIIVAIALSFAGILVVEGGMGPVAALKESARLTKGHRMELFKLALASLGVNILGLLALGVGLLVTVPTTMISFIHAYRAIAGKGSEEELVIVPEEVVTA